jgi:hypothetical protein
MNLDKLKERLDSAKVVEELIDLSKKVFGKSDDVVNNVVELFITKAYLMGKRNQVKTFDE